MDARLELLKMLPKNAVGVEIGVHKGEFSQRIINVTNPSKLYLIDPWKCFEEDTYDKSWYGKTTPQQDLDRRYESVKAKFSARNNVHIIRKLSQEAADDIPDNSLDFVYIDGDHTFEGTCADFKSFYPKIKNGGFICGDDYSKNNWWKTGVVDALHLNLHEKNLMLRLLIQDQYCCQKIGN